MDTSHAKGRKDDGWRPVGLGSPWWRSFRGPGQRRRPMQPGDGFVGSMSQWAADDARLRRLDRIRLWSLLALVSLGIVVCVALVVTP